MNLIRWLFCNLEVLCLQAPWSHHLKYSHNVNPIILHVEDDFLRFIWINETIRRIINSCLMNMEQCNPRRIQNKAKIKEKIRHITHEISKWSFDNKISASNQRSTWKLNDKIKDKTYRWWDSYRMGQYTHRSLYHHLHRFLQGVECHGHCNGRRGSRRTRRIW